MKLIVLIAAHKNEAQINRLIRALAHPDIKIYVHIDKKSEVIPAHIHSGAVLVKNSIKVVWSAFSQVQATINSLREIIAREPDFDYITLISGQDYPVMTAEAIISSISANRGRELIGHVPLDEKGWNAARIRFERFHFISYDHWFVRAAGSVLAATCNLLHLKRTFYKGMAPYGGSAWWTLSNECIHYILNFLDSHKGFISFMKKTIFSDEIIFQTIIMNSPLKDSAFNDDFRYLERKKFKGNSHPEILTVSDFQKITGSGKHFARKFDMETDSKILDMIDEYRDKQFIVSQSQ